MRTNKLSEAATRFLKLVESLKFRISGGDFDCVTLGVDDGSGAYSFPEFSTTEELADYMGKDPNVFAFLAVNEPDGSITVRKARWPGDDEQGTGTDEQGREWAIHPLDAYQLDEDDFPHLME